MEQDQVQDHEHEDSGHQHGCSATSTAGSHTHSYNYPDLYWANTGLCGSNLNECDDEVGAKAHTSTSASVTVQTSCSTSTHSSDIGGVDSAARSGTETRPINMKVSYVMRCW